MLELGNESDFSTIIVEKSDKKKNNIVKFTAIVTIAVNFTMLFLLTLRQVTYATDII